jgi:integrase
MNQKIVQYTRPGGERFCSLINSDSGLPIIYPTLFIISQIRRRSFSSVQSATAALKTGYDFFEHSGIDLHERIIRGNFLTIYEIDALHLWCQNKKIRGIKTNVVSLHSRHKSARGTGRPVSENCEHQRLTHIANYIAWLSDRIADIPFDPTARAQSTKCADAIKARRPTNNRRTLIQDIGLTDIDLDRIFAFLHPNAPNNVLKSYGICLRNYLLFSILRDTGIRSGELLSLQITDFDRNTNPPRIRIIRRADEPADSRQRQPLVKSNERTIPISEALASLIEEYINKYRRKVSHARKHPYLIIAHRNGNGQTTGFPLSINSYQSIVSKLRGATMGMLSDKTHLRGHEFRKAWNRRFSELFDNNPKLTQSPDEQEKIRSEIMGWNPNSEMAQLYNRRFIQRKAQETILALADKVNHPRPTEESLP